MSYELTAAELDAETVELLPAREALAIANVAVLGNKNTLTEITKIAHQTAAAFVTNSHNAVIVGSDHSTARAFGDALVSISQSAR